MTELRDVQIEALNRAAGKTGYLWALEPGLGKSLTALMEFIRVRRIYGVSKLLVICPNSVIGTWRDEIKKHNIDITPGALMVINYEALIYSGGKEVLKFCRGGKTMLVIDESHRIKNHKSKTTKWILDNLAMRPTTIRLLTGTPMAESPMDLYPQLRMCHATPGVNPYVWRNRWCIMGGYKAKVIQGCKDPEGLAKFCEPYMFRATKTEWAESLPEKTFSIRQLEMTSEQRKVYFEMKQEFCSEFEGKEVTATMIATVMGKLQQITTGFFLADDGVPTPIGDRNPKLDAMSDWAAEFRGGNKFIIVTVHKFVARMAITRLIQDGHNIVSLYGDSPLSVDEAKDKFNGDDSVDGIVLSIKKGGVGLTLLGSDKRPCADMLFLQSSWSLIERLQVIDRIHRIGQKFPCNYTDLVVAELDRQIVNSLNRKEEGTHAVLRFLNRTDDDQLRVA